MIKKHEGSLHPAWWSLIFVAAIILALVFTQLDFNQAFTSFTPVTLTADRAGLLMEPHGKVKFRGVQVGEVTSIEPGNPVKMQLNLYSTQLKFIPADVAAQITAPTIFGAKYVDLLAPQNPSPRPLAAGAELAASNVSIESNTVLQNLAGVLKQIDVVKLNAVLSALAEGFRGKGEKIGEATTDLNQVLMAINPRSETIRADFRAVKGFADTYSAAAPDLVKTLDALSTTSSTITGNAKQLDSLLLNVTGLSNSGIKLIAPNKDNLINAINVLEPTTRLLKKYNPELTCTLVGGQKVLDKYDWGGVLGLRNRKSIILDIALLMGDDPYKYPDNLPINGIKGGPGGVPGCGSLPDVADNWPVRQLITNSGWGTGLDWRPNPGIGFPGYGDWFPTTRAVPESPSVRYPGGPAPGPIPYPGAPAYGATRYAPDGTPLYPGMPPAPPAGRPMEPGPAPAGSEPFVPPHTAELQPTPLEVPAPPPPPPPDFAPTPPLAAEFAPTPPTP
jgi:phospholipid/cholesterol/gamma-HCH transport system substrate-binding protein